MTPPTTKLNHQRAHDIVSTRQTSKPKRGLNISFWHRNWLNVATLSGGSTSFRRRTRGGALSTPRQVNTRKNSDTNGSCIERFNDPIYTVNKFRVDRVEFDEDASVSANRFYALYSEYCWEKNYPRQTKSAVLEWVGKWSVEFSETEDGTTDQFGNPWTFIEGISVKGRYR